MNILFLYISLPHLSNKNDLFPSLIHTFKSNGHNVFVSSNSCANKTRVFVEDDVPVLRISSPKFNGIKSNFKKAISYQWYSLKQLFYIRKKWGKHKFDLIISHSLPPELGLIIRCLKGHFKCSFFLNVTDYTWQDAVAYGYIRKNGLIVKYYRFFEKLSFKLSDYIAVPTKGNIEYILGYYPWIDKSKFLLLPFWQSPLQINNYEKCTNSIYPGKFVVVYGGSVGAAQGFERVIDLALSCVEYRDILFCIIGKGAYLDSIKRLSSRYNLNNVSFIDYMPQNEYLNFLSSCDVGLVVLNEKMASPNFPSKSVSYFNMHVPLLAALDHVTDFGFFLDTNKIGLWAFSDDIQMLKNKLLCYYNSKDLRMRIADNARSFLHNYLTPTLTYTKIMNHILR